MERPPFETLVEPDSYHDRRYEAPDRHHMDTGHGVREFRDKFHAPRHSKQP